MPMFKVWERVDAIRIYNVEADSATEACRMVEDAEVDYREEDFYEYNVFDVEEVKE